MALRPYDNPPKPAGTRPGFLPHDPHSTRPDPMKCLHRRNPDNPKWMSTQGVPVDGAWSDVLWAGLKQSTRKVCAICLIERCVVCGNLCSGRFYETHEERCRG